MPSKPRKVTSEGHATASMLSHSLGAGQNHCFGCGPANPIGLRLRFRLDESSGSATAVARLNRRFEGPPGHVHGGILATLLDEAMGKVNKLFNRTAVTRHLTIEYLRPAPLNTPLTVTGRMVSHTGRKMFMEGEIRDAAGELLVLGRALFIQVDANALLARAAKRAAAAPRPARS
jgi:uncharacterized protein (TIGR00369 family)